MSLNLTPSQVSVVIKHSPKGSLTLAAAQVQLSIKAYKHKAIPVPSVQTDRTDTLLLGQAGASPFTSSPPRTLCWEAQSWNSGLTEKQTH